MDPALPPGGLQRIMQQYDAIRSHASVPEEAAPWEPEEERGVVFAQNTTPQEAKEWDASSLKVDSPLRTKERVELANRSRQ